MCNLIFDIPILPIPRYLFLYRKESRNIRISSAVGLPNMEKYRSINIGYRCCSIDSGILATENGIGCL
jgi:hypothetical protein